VQYRCFVLCILSVAVRQTWASDPSAPGVPNFHEVNPHVFRGGQPSDIAWNSLAHLGIKVVVDLRPSNEHPVQAEKRAVEAAGMQYINVPMKGFVAPSTASVSKVLGFLVSNSTGPVFVHCRRGSDRTGTVLACYRILHDHWNNRQALQEARSYGMMRMERGMMHFIERFTPPAELQTDLPTASPAAAQ
jgi:tyrosine-protein phosphatase SIW14